MSLYQTNDGWDAVSGEQMSVTFNGAQASVFGGDDWLYLADGAGNAASLYQTDGEDRVFGSGGAVTLNDAQASVSGGGDWIYFASGAGNAVNLSNTFGDWDIVTGAGGVITLSGARASVFGGGNEVEFAAGAGNAASLYATNGDDDVVEGSNGAINLTDAGATLIGDDDRLYLSGANALTVQGASEAFVFQPAIGRDVINGFALSDAMQFSSVDFADWSALSAHIAQSGADAVITLDADDKITLTGVFAAKLAASQFHFV